jgi:hypothetical protein
MFADQWPKIITASVAPVVIISASALLSLAFYNRLAAIVTRLRAVQRERLELHARMGAMEPGDVKGGAVLQQTCLMESLAEQTANIWRRARLIRATLLNLMGAIAAMVMSSLMNGLTIVWPQAFVGTAMLFIGGMVFLMAAVACASAELIIALDPVELEAGVVSELTGFPTSMGYESVAGIRDALPLVGAVPDGLGT